MEKAAKDWKVIIDLVTLNRLVQWTKFKMTLLENSGAQEIRGQTIENQTSEQLSKNVFLVHICPTCCRVYRPTGDVYILRAV